MSWKKKIRRKGEIVRLFLRNSAIIFHLHESGSLEAEVRVAEDVDKMQEVMKGIEIHHECEIS